MQACSRLMEGPMRRHFEFGLIASGRIVHCLCQRPKQSALDEIGCFMVFYDSWWVMMIFVLRCPSLLSSSVLLALCWPFNSSSQESDPAVKEVCRNSIDLRYTVITHDVRIAAETAGTNLETSCGTEEPMPWCWKVDHQSITAEFDDVTPVRIDKPEFRISMSKYDKSESRIKSWRQLAAKSIESGIQHGFRGLLRISQTACVGCSAHFWCITNPNFNHCYDCKFAPVFQSRNWISGVKNDVKHCESSSAPLVFSASRSVRAVKPLASENTTAPEPLCRTRVSGCTSPCR